MEKLTEVLAMGGFAAYVWPAFATAAIVMAILAFLSISALKRAKKSLAQLQSVQDET